MSNVQELNFSNGHFFAEEIGEKLVQPQQWCARQWNWFAGPIAVNTGSSKALQMAFRVIVFLPLVLFTAFACSCYLVGRAIKSYSSQEAESKSVIFAPKQSVNALLDQNTRDVLLLEAAKKGVKSAVEGWLKAGANPNAVDAKGNSAVHIAAINNHAELIPLLVAAGANVNLRNPHNLTPLLEAVWDENRCEVVEALVKAGADTNVHYDGYGEYALHAVVQRKNVRQLKALLSDPNLKVNQLSGVGKTALFHAMDRHFSAGARLLVERGANVNCVVDNASNTYHQCSALHLCNEQDETDPDLVDYLIQKGADPNRRDAEGQPPLAHHIIHYVVVNQHDGQHRANKVRNVITKMFANGADPNSNYDKDGKPLLAYLAGRNGSYSEMDCHLDLLELWIAQKGIDLEKADPLGCTAIMWAALLANEEAFETLLNAGARFNPHQYEKVRLMAMRLLPLKQIESNEQVDRIRSQCETPEAPNPYLAAFKECMPLKDGFPLRFKSKWHLFKAHGTLLEGLRVIKENVTRTIAVQQTVRTNLLRAVTDACEGTGLLKELVNEIVDYLQMYHPQVYPQLPVEDPPVDINSIADND